MAEVQKLTIVLFTLNKGKKYSNVLHKVNNVHKKNKVPNQALPKKQTNKKTPG